MPPPDIAFDALKAFDVQNASGYGSSRGDKALLDALSAWYAREFGRSTTAAHHVITNGAKQAIMIALLALCDVGDEIAIPNPYWPSYLDIARLAGLKVNVLPHLSGAPDVGAWIDHLGDQTKVIMYSSPANPTGSVLSANDLQTLSRWAKETNRWIIADEIYQFQYYSGDTAAPSVLQLPEEDSPQVIHISSASKTFSLMGHRIGWITAHPNVIARCSGIASNMAGNVNTAGQSLVTRALSAPREELARRSAQLKHQRDVLCAALDDSVPWLHWKQPDGGLFLWCELADGSGCWDGDTIAAALLADQHIAVVPGSVFGRCNALRLSFTEPPDRIVEGVERIRRWGESYL